MIQSVPKVKRRREGWFWCGTCGEEEEIYPGAPPGYIPNLCSACTSRTMEKLAAGGRNVAVAVDDLTEATARWIEEMKIEVNEGRRSEASLRRIVEAHENVKRIAADMRRKQNDK